MMRRGLTLFRRNRLVSILLSVVGSLLSVVFLSGCLSTKVTSYEDRQRAAHPKDHIVKIVDLKQVHRPYDVIGYIHIKASELYSAEYILNKMRKKARQMGGDALSDVNQQVLEEKFPQFFDYLNFYGTVWSAEVLAWREE